MTLPPKFDADLCDHLQRHGTHKQLNADEVMRADGLSPQLRNIFAEQERDHIQRRADRRFRAIFWTVIIGLTLGGYTWGLSLFFGGAS